MVFLSKIRVKGNPLSGLNPYAKGSPRAYAKEIAGKMINVANSAGKKKFTFDTGQTYGTKTPFDLKEFRDRGVESISMHVAHRQALHQVLSCMLAGGELPQALLEMFEANPLVKINYSQQKKDGLFKKIIRSLGLDFKAKAERRKAEAERLKAENLAGKGILAINAKALRIRGRSVEELKAELIELGLGRGAKVKEGIHEEYDYELLRLIKKQALLLNIDQETAQAFSRIISDFFCYGAYQLEDLGNGEVSVQSPGGMEFIRFRKL